MENLINEAALTNTIDWYLSQNPQAIEVMLTNQKQFVLDALKAEQQYLAEFVSNENKMNAFCEFIAPRIFNKIN
jgi:hypothetical protein